MKAINSSERDVCLTVHREIGILTHFSPVPHFYTPSKRQKTKCFLKFSGDIEMWHWTKMGYSTLIIHSAQCRLFTSAQL